MKKVSFLFIAAASFAATAMAASPKSSIWGNAKTDQERCEKEAEYMAKYRAFYHVGPCIGRFEGIGYGGLHPNINTCTPHYNMRLTGDASAQCENGQWVRVRSWR
jgi:hypothetical protein